MHDAKNVQYLKEFNFHTKSKYRTPALCRSPASSESMNWALLHCGFECLQNSISNLRMLSWIEAWREKNGVYLILIVFHCQELDTWYHLKWKSSLLPQTAHQTTKSLWAPFVFNTQYTCTNPIVGITKQHPITASSTKIRISRYGMQNLHLTWMRLFIVLQSTI